ncbi:MAG: polyprenyl synthetase family protein [Phycisphaerae bacterium]
MNLPVDSSARQAAALLARRRDLIEAALHRYLQPADDIPAPLAEAMRYSVFAGGKRFRPALLLACSQACGGSVERALPAAAALECAHTFSLIHDDLPAMDDDDLRRGKPTSHRVFGEAMAILAGDALLALAFEILAAQPNQPALAARLSGELASAVGWGGMIGGQAADLLGQHQNPTPQRVQYIHRRKTARLIQCACRMGAMIADADAPRLNALSRYGLELGLAFQIVDDLLDATSSSQAAGKRTGKDSPAGKQTYPRVVGIQRSRAAAASAVDSAINALAPLGPQAEELILLARFVLERAS